MLTKTDLLGHQESAYNKLINILVGALFMEMGTGKTRTAIEFIKHRKSKIDSVFWFCPVSLKETILMQFLEHSTLDTKVICLFNDTSNETNSKGFFLYIIGIESMSLSKRVVIAVNKLITCKSFVIVDESSAIKGHKALRTERITRIAERAKYRMILTGTPISQGIVDLYAQFRFLSPKILGYTSFYSFAANHLEYSDKFPGMIVRAHNTEWIAAKIQPYVYQVTKKECLNLPEKIYDYRVFSLTPEQKSIYEETKEKILSDMENADYSSSVFIFKLFTALQQIVSGFYVTKTPEGKCFNDIPHRRLQMLIETIESVPETAKIIIFAKFEYDILQIQKKLTDLFSESAVSYFYGKSNEKKRNKEIHRFKKDARFLLSTQSCGGYGYTLNESHYMIFYNNVFKYSERLQAEDRNHRIGQQNGCTYIDIRANCGIDNRIYYSHQKKGNVIDDFKDEVNRVKDNKSYIKELIQSL